MDAFAVSLSNGLAYRGFGRRQAIEAAAAFGLFHSKGVDTGGDRLHQQDTQGKTARDNLPLGGAQLW